MNDILANLQAVKDRMLTETGYGPPYQLFCSGRRLIEMYRHGALRPDDDTIMPMIPAADIPLVEAYLRDEHGKPSGAATG